MRPKVPRLLQPVRSAISNVAGLEGGGVFVGCFAEAAGAVAGGNVQGNQPHDVAPEMGCL